MSSTRQLAMVNDMFVDQLSVADRGLAFGDGVFETMRLAAGRVALLEYHLDRLESGCNILAIPVDRARIKSSLAIFLTAISDPAPTIIKLIVTRGAGGRGSKPPAIQTTDPTVIWQCLPLEDTTQLARLGVKLHPCKLPLYSTPFLAGIKHLNRLNYVMAASELSEGGDIQGLLLDEDGKVVESLHHNLFFVKNNQLYTPMLKSAGVKGVVRRLILERFAPSCALTAHEGRYGLADLLAADEVFLCNGVRGIWPVKLCGDKQWQTPGAVTVKLQSMVDSVFAGGAIA